MLFAMFILNFLYFEAECLPQAASPTVSSIAAPCRHTNRLNPSLPLIQTGRLGAFTQVESL